MGKVLKLVFTIKKLPLWLLSIRIDRAMLFWNKFFFLVCSLQNRRPPVLFFFVFFLMVFSGFWAGIKQELSQSRDDSEDIEYKDALNRELSILLGSETWMTSRVENNIKLLRKLIADFEVDYLISCSKLKKKNLETMIDFKNQEIKKLSTQLNNLRLDEKRNQQNQQMLNRELEFLVRPGKKKHSRRGFTSIDKRYKKFLNKGFKHFKNF